MQAHIMAYLTYMSGSIFTSDTEHEKLFTEGYTVELRKKKQHDIYHYRENDELYE